MMSPSTRPDRSPDAIASRRWSDTNSRALIQHQGYGHDPVLEDICKRWVIGELSDADYEQEILRHCRAIAERANGN